ncbi:MAG: ribosome biogenesis GTP-binding protein YihA/YsxC, partial [Eubacteriales bacterium]
MKLPNLNIVSLKISAGRPNQFPADGIPQIAFSGRSNVGKSSLINCLLGRKSLARVSGTPGKTITVNFYNVDNTLYFVDLPGYGFARRSADSKRVWSDLTEVYVNTNTEIVHFLTGQVF